MGKDKNKSTNKAKGALPKAPWIYINEATSSSPIVDVAPKLFARIPKASFVCQTACLNRPVVDLRDASQTRKLDDPIQIFVDPEPDAARAATAAKRLCETSIKRGNNFVSVRLYEGSIVKEDETTEEKKTNKEENKKEENQGQADWGTNHLNIDMKCLTAETAADEIIQWLFKTLSVPETLHLIPEADMYATDQKNFPDYAYCAVGSAHEKPKDARVQFVALILTKPEVGTDQRLHWSVVDRTGEAKFHFQYRGPSSQATWDWVLALQPGDLRALPRMPMVHVAERKRTMLLKAPFRGAAAVVTGTGLAVKSIGVGLCWVGDKVRLGPSGGMWVAEADVRSDGDVCAATDAGIAEKKSKTKNKTTRGIKVFNEKCCKFWSHRHGRDDSHDDEKAACEDNESANSDAASTIAASVCDEKMVKEFC